MPNVYDDYSISLNIILLILYVVLNLNQHILNDFDTKSFDVPQSRDHNTQVIFCNKVVASVLYSIESWIIDALPSGFDAIYVRQFSPDVIQMTRLWIYIFYHCTFKTKHNMHEILMWSVFIWPEFHFVLHFIWIYGTQTIQNRACIHYHERLMKFC